MLENHSLKCLVLFVWGWHTCMFDNMLFWNHACIFVTFKKLVWSNGIIVVKYEESEKFVLLVKTAQKGMLWFVIPLSLFQTDTKLDENQYCTSLS